MSYKVKQRREKVAKLMAEAIPVHDIAKIVGVSFQSLRGDIRAINKALEVAKRATAGSDSKHDVLNIYDLEVGDYVSPEQFLISLALGYTLISPRGFRYKKIYDKICYNSNPSDELFTPTSLTGLNNFKIYALPRKEL